MDDPEPQIGVVILGRRESGQLSFLHDQGIHVFHRLYLRITNNRALLRISQSKLQQGLVILIPKESETGSSCSPTSVGCVHPTKYKQYLDLNSIIIYCFLLLLFFLLNKYWFVFPSFFLFFFSSFLPSSFLIYLPFLATLQQPNEIMR